MRKSKKRWSQYALLLNHQKQLENNVLRRIGKNKTARKRCLAFCKADRKREAKRFHTSIGNSSNYKDCQTQYCDPTCEYATNASLDAKDNMKMRRGISSFGFSKKYTKSEMEKLKRRGAISACEYIK